MNSDQYVPNKYFGGTILWNPNAALQTTTGGQQSPALGLGHELAHAFQYHFLSGFRDITGGHDDEFDFSEERRVITGPEAAAANTLGEDRRFNHRGHSYWVPSSTSR